jgi:hypothetical protein
MSSGCESSGSEKLSAYKRYYLANKEQIQAKRREWKKANHDKVLKYQADYRNANRDSINQKKKREYHDTKHSKIDKISGFWGGDIKSFSPDFPILG